MNSVIFGKEQPALCDLAAFITLPARQDEWEYARPNAWIRGQFLGRGVGGGQSATKGLNDISDSSRLDRGSSGSFCGCCYLARCLPASPPSAPSIYWPWFAAAFIASMVSL